MPKGGLEPPLLYSNTNDLQTVVSVWISVVPGHTSRIPPAP